MSGTRAENEFPQASPAAAVAPADRLDRILQILAERALLETGATSVAIGLLRDGAVTCRATAGLPMTAVGDPINHQTGLTGLAIRRQMSQWCSDTESDARVDQEVCRQLGVRSIIVSPVLVQDSVVGVFAIFSPNPDALSLADLNAVKKLSHWVSEAVRYTVRKPSPLTRPPRHCGPGGFKPSAAVPLRFRARAGSRHRKLFGQNLASYGLGIVRGAQWSHRPRLDASWSRACLWPSSRPLPLTLFT